MKDLLNCYSKEVRQIFDRLFTNINTDGVQFHADLTAAIISCFHLDSCELDSLLQAEVILEQLFTSFSATSSCPFQLSSFLESYVSKTVKKRLLTSLLSGLYFKDINLALFQEQSHCNNLELLMFQLLAEKASKSSLKKILAKLSTSQQVFLLHYVFKNYREGSYAIINEFESLYTKKRQRTGKYLLNLISGLKNNYYDRNTFYKAIAEHITIDAQLLNALMQDLDALAKQHTQEFFFLFNSLIPLMIDSPVRVYDAIEELKKTLPDSGYQPTPIERKRAEEQKASLYRRFETYLSSHYSLENILQFAKIFGLKGQFPFLRVLGKQLFADSLIEKMHLMHQIFNEPLTLAQMPHDETVVLFDFALAIISHLEAIRHPSAFSEGLDLLTCAIVTKGKVLSEQPSLPSVLKGFNNLKTYLDSYNLGSYPLYVFDQSLPALFKKNQLFINKLNRRHGCAIVHVSKEEALKLSRKVGLEPLLNTTRTGDFGFGGARNCVFLLTPWLRLGYRRGMETVESMLKMKTHAVKALFRESVLDNDSSENANGHSVLIIDDDMEIPAANIFSHLLFAKEIRHIFTCCCGFCSGRATKYSLKFPTLSDVLSSPENHYAHTEWTNIPFYASMPQCIGKPRVFLNLPFGHEESHVIIPWTINLMLQGAYHLGGTRYSDKNIPTHWIVGLEGHLKDYVPYSMGIYLAMDLIDPSDLSGRCILPWNIEGKPAGFFSLSDCLAFIAKASTKKEIRQRYWKNVRDLFEVPSSKAIPLRQCIDDLIYTDVNIALHRFRKEFEKTEKLNRIENASLENIGELYKFFQDDAILFNEFGLEILNKMNEICDSELVTSKLLNRIQSHIEKQRGINFADYPITYGFYLLCRSVGAGEFCDMIKSIVEQKNKIS